MGWLTERRRHKILEQPFSPRWRAHLEANVAAYARMDAGGRKRLEDLVQVFVAEKHWEGCGGLSLTDEMRVTVAGQGCRMVLGRDLSLLSDVESILVYPTTVLQPPRPPMVFEAPGRIVGADPPALGLSFRRGPVILAWDEIESDRDGARYGRNLVIHELAHKIDMRDGIADGTPALRGKAARREWAEVCSGAFAALREQVARGDDAVLDPYATTNEAEFFAVASEAFFERPRDLGRDVPDLYGVLARFYNLDPAAASTDPRLRDRGGAPRASR